MLFNSYIFAVFLIVAFSAYWFIFQRNLRLQNIFLLVASYVFYGWWDYRFLGLIFFSTLTDYFAGIFIEKSEKKSRRILWLGISLVVNLGMLMFFKYWNFFIDSWIEMWSSFGIQMSGRTLNIILPVGISFYTFQTLSYTIDIFRKKAKPTTDFISFAAFVSFFPQLVAGPIERATNLLPQFFEKRVFDYTEARLGMQQILWGLFKKVVIADTCAIYADEIFANYTNLPGSTLLLGSIYFAFQIYGDFSGYSDIAIGTARLFGFRLMTNFRYPYFSRDIAEFWRRWHISLSTWFRDYLYIPLGGSRGSKKMQLRNVMIIFVVSGFWHGANFTFIIWGALNALYFLPLLLAKQNRKNLDTVAQGGYMPNLRETYQVLLTFALTCFAWIFFRSETVGDAMNYLGEIFSPSLFVQPGYLKYLPMLAAFTILEWIGREKEHFLRVLDNRPVLRYAAYAVLILMVDYQMGEGAAEFIYFQF